MAETDEGTCGSSHWCAKASEIWKRRDPFVFFLHGLFAGFSGIGSLKCEDAETCDADP